LNQSTLDVSVVICAYTEERWAALQAAVDSVRSQSVLPREIIIVADHNPALLARVREQYTDAIVVENHEPRGLSGARNSGIAAARGALIAFLDDDAIAETTWVEKLAACCEDPEVLGAGTFVEPVWETDRPAWFPEEFYWVVGCSYRGLPRTQLPVRNLTGGSMCLRREIFEIVGGFRTGIGRTSARPLGCEETELCIRAGQHWPHKFFLYDPRIQIQHRIPASRTCWAYFRARCYAEGQSKALVARHVGAGAGLASERTYTLKILPQGVVRGVADAVLRRDRTGLARAGAIVAGLAITTAGYCQQWLSQKMTGRSGHVDASPIAAHQSKAQS
jgi:glucosyl-dolichyl phosphate glucuronosyltransferase